MSYTNLKPSDINSLEILPEVIQQLIAEWTGLFMPFTQGIYNAGFRKLLFSDRASTDCHFRETIVVNDYYISNPLYLRYPGIKTRFEKNQGHKELEMLTGRSWENLSSLDSVDIQNTNGGNLIQTGIPPDDELYSNDDPVNIDAIPFKLPREIKQLTQLLEFGISDSSVISIPSEIGCLINLREFWLFDNDYLFDVPSDIGKLVNLVTLTLENNLNTIPDEIRNLTNLQNLRLRGPITTIPDLSTLSENLLTFQCVDTNLPRVPPWLGNLTNLNHLDISLNTFTTLPDSMSSLVDLEFLLMSDICLEILPSWVCTFTNLASLDLSYNELTCLPDGLLELDLVILHLYGNPANLMDVLRLAAANLKPL